MKNIYYPNHGVLPYESQISIILKISRLNFVELDRLKMIWGQDNNWDCSTKLFSEVAIFGKIGATESNIVYHHIPPAFVRDIRHEFSFCSECNDLGYHSVFNLIANHSVCTLHKCTLQLACDICRKKFLLGFDFDETRSQTKGRCPDCGFVNTDLASSIRKCQSASLLHAVSRAGDHVSAWYHSVSNLYYQHDIDAFDYYSSGNDRQILTSPLAEKLGIPSPEHIAKCVPITGKVHWIGHPGYISHRDGATFLMRRQTIAEACREIEVKYLSRHFACMQSMNILTNPLIESRGIHRFCPVALAYAILRLKLENDIWPTSSPSSSCLSAGIANFKAIVSPLGRTGKPQELTVYFLHVLGELQFMISKGRNFWVVCGNDRCGGDHVRRRCYLRKTTLKFRYSCQVFGTCTTISRQGIHGALMISVRPAEIDNYNMLDSDVLVL